MGDTWDDITQQHESGPGRGGDLKTKQPGPWRSGYQAPPAQPESWGHWGARQAVGALPAVGATVGGVVGAPGVVTGVAGAAVGAGLGEVGRQVLTGWFPTLGHAPKGGGEAAEEIGKQFLIGGVTEAIPIGKLFEKASPWLKGSAKRSLVAAMGPQGKYAEGHALDAADQFLEGPAKDYVALSRKGLLKRAEKKIGTVGAEIGAKEAPVAGKTIDPALMTELNQSLDALNNSFYMKPQTGPLGTVSIQAKYGYQPHIEALDAIRQHVANEMPNGTLNRESLRLVRQSVDNAVRRAEGFSREAMVKGGAVEPALASKIEVERNAGDVFRKILNKDEPDIAALNAEYHLWQNVKDAISPAELRKQFSKETSRWQQLWHDRYAAWLGTAAIGAGTAVGRIDTTSAAEATGALFAISSLMNTTAWRTTSAAVKNQMADMLAKGQFEAVAKLATRAALQKNTTLPPPVQKEVKQQTATVKMTSPDGKLTQEVPKDQVEHYKKLGAAVVQ